MSLYYTMSPVHSVHMYMRWDVIALLYVLYTAVMRLAGVVRMSMYCIVIADCQSSVPCLFLYYQWCSSQNSSLGPEMSRDSVLMSWSWDAKSWSWSSLGPFKPWFLVSEVRNHVRNYDFSEKGSFSPKNLIFRGFGGTLAALQYFCYYL